MIESKESTMNESMKVYPVLKEAFRSLYKPGDHTGFYMNDHTVFKTEGKEHWNVIGITSDVEANPQQEKHFANGVGESLSVGNFEDNPATKGRVLDSKNMQVGQTPHPIRPGDEAVCWAPHVVYEEGIYHMYYYTNLEKHGILNKSETGYATSTDLIHWENKTETLAIYLPNGEGGWKEGNIPATRDPMIIKIDDKWLMYQTALTENEKSAVAVYDSKDMINWYFRGFALIMDGDAPHVSWSSGESPFLIKRGENYVLSVTITDCGKDSYNVTHLFQSTNPYKFGVFYGLTRLGECPSYVATLPVHAPEYVYDEDHDRWFVTSCGWPTLTKYEKTGATNGGVAIAEIEWVTKEGYEQYQDTCCDNHLSAIENHSFETGDLSGWVTEGDFGDHMIVKGNVTDAGVVRDIHGQYSFSSKVGAGDDQKGSMCSSAFLIEVPISMTFRIGGGNNIEELYVALVDAETDEILLKETGRDTDNMNPVEWDLSKYEGKSCYIKVVDHATGNNGYITVDAFEI